MYSTCSDPFFKAQNSGLKMLWVCRLKLRKAVMARVRGGGSRRSAIDSCGLGFGV